MNALDNSLYFTISSGLKNIIGRELITDKYIALFELIKNSYDAEASRVVVLFEKTNDKGWQIVVSDDGCGMSKNDITNKWLFVAYSEKKSGNWEGIPVGSNRKREFVGAKGVGRFSCDILGTRLKMITKTKSEPFAHVVEVDWDKFEEDDKQEFASVPVVYSTQDALPGGNPQGTTLVIGNLREDWPRSDILRLKSSLKKLISPEACTNEFPFVIELKVPSESENDKKARPDKDGRVPDYHTVNGIVHNDIFERLNIKTTSITVDVSKDGRSITTKLHDRGEYIFSIARRNRDYAELHDLFIVVYYLNRSAKTSFTRQMGLAPKNYGSVFIYKNGFRINPYGKPGADFFNIDQRKTQGWKRYLGTREIMGRILINGENKQFIETTSRAQGFVQNNTVDSLKNFFLEEVLKVLEKYVVNIINWGQPLKIDSARTVSPDEVGDKIVEQFITSVSPDDVVSVDYNHHIFDKIQGEGDSQSISATLKKIERMAISTADPGLYKLARDLKKKTEFIISQNLQLENENRVSSKALAIAKKEEIARKQQVFFLKGAANQNVANLLGGFHSVLTLTDAVRGSVNQLLELLDLSNEKNNEKRGELFSIVWLIYRANEKARKLADLAINGNQSLRQTGKRSLYDFIRQYVDTEMGAGDITCELKEDDRSFDCAFDPVSVGIIIDNIVSNSAKAGATILRIALDETSDHVEVVFSDNGVGLDSSIDPESLFEFGFSSNRQKKGFGIGLPHIRQLVAEMEGDVAIDDSYNKQGFKLLVRLRK